MQKALLLPPGLRHLWWCCRFLHVWPTWQCSKEQHHKPMETNLCDLWAPLGDRGLRSKGGNHATIASSGSQRCQGFRTCIVYLNMFEELEINVNIVNQVDITPRSCKTIATTYKPPAVAKLRCLNLCFARPFYHLTFSLISQTISFRCNCGAAKRLETWVWEMIKCR